LILQIILYGGEIGSHLKRRILAGAFENRVDSKIFVRGWGK